MKTRFILIIILLITSLSASAQNLDKMPVEKRNVRLISIAKKAVKKYAPDYYREYGTPKIESYTLKKEGDLEYGERVGRIRYRIIFPYDENKEYFENGFSAMVEIWADDGTLTCIFPGNGPGRGFKVNEAGSKNEKVKKFHYVKRTKPRPNSNVTIIKAQEKGVNDN
ncbi:hypothetical protein [Bacteroides congonensis]